MHAAAVNPNRMWHLRVHQGSWLKRDRVSRDTLAGPTNPRLGEANAANFHAFFGLSAFDQHLLPLYQHRNP